MIDQIFSDLKGRVDNQRYVAGDVGQIQRFFHRGIALPITATFGSIKETVAGGAAGNTLPMKACSDGSPKYLWKRRWR